MPVPVSGKAVSNRQACSSTRQNCSELVDLFQSMARLVLGAAFPVVVLTKLFLQLAELLL
jgi:hypothetical protein